MSYSIWLPRSRASVSYSAQRWLLLFQFNAIGGGTIHRRALRGFVEGYSKRGRRDGNPKFAGALYGRGLAKQKKAMQPPMPILLPRRLFNPISQKNSRATGLNNRAGSYRVCVARVLGQPRSVF